MIQNNFSTPRQVLKKLDLNKDKFISREFQAYGYYLARELNDLAHKALYIKYAKEMPRGILEEALSLTKNATKVKSKARLFMWKLKEMKKNDS